jgi:arylsulfatase A
MAQYPAEEVIAMNTLRSRRDFLKAAGLSAAFSVLPASAEKQSASPPNIIFIMADDLGYADLGCYGSKAIATPRIDRMAAEGMRFTDAYSGCTFGAPARSTLMTGTHMGHTSVRGNTGGIPLEASDVTFAQVLKKAGYATGGFGKWGLGDIDTPGVPEKHGFDTFFGYYHQIHAHYYYPEYLIRNGKKVPLPGNRGRKQNTYSHRLIFEETTTFIRENRDRPFFCYCPWTPPHGRYEIPEDEPAMKKYAGKDWPAKAKVAAAMSTLIDRHTGEILDLLDELGIAENTLVFFCSDNGASYRFEESLESSGPLRGRKRDMYEGGIRVPLIARWPGRIQPGAVSELPCYFPDMMPAFCELAGVPDAMPENIDGISIVPELLGRGDQEKHECLYWEWPLYDWRKRAYVENGLMQAVRSGNWKMLRHRQNEAWELYDLENDIGEQSNIAEKHPEIIARLTAWIEANRKEMHPQIEPEMPEGKKFR